MYDSLFKGGSFSDPTDRHVDEDAQASKAFDGEVTRRLSPRKLGLTPVSENDRREHRRFSVSKGAGLEVSFGSIQAFAKSYLRDISLGGAYIQTEMRPPLGTLMPISFHIEQSESSGSLNFELRGQVIRHGADGVGLKFTNLEGEIRRSLEDFLAQNISSPISSPTPAKKSTLGRVADMRERAEDSRVKRRALYHRLMILVAGLLLNVWLGSGLKEQLKYSDQTRLPSLVLDSGKAIPVRDIRGLKSTDNGIEIIVGGSEKFILSPTEEKQLPPHLLLSSRASLRGKEAPRHSRNNPPGRVRLR